jgi:HEAT repeat protein
MEGVMFRSIRLVILFLPVLVLASCGDKRAERQKVLADLTAALRDSDTSVQAQALIDISAVGRDAQSAAPILLDLLKAKDRTVRKYAALAVGRCVKPEEAVPALTAALTDSDVDVRRQAAMGLGEIGPAAQSALPALEEFSKEPDRCASAATAIKNIRK